MREIANGRKGDAAMRRCGERAIATKWLNRTAQGFSPGYGRYRGRALISVSQLFTTSLCFAAKGRFARL